MSGPIREAATRREFLSWSALAATGAAGVLGTGWTLAGCAGTVAGAGPRRRGLILGPGSSDGDAPGAVSHHLALVDLDAPGPAAELLPLDFMGHGVVPDPTNPARAAIFEKRGAGACIVDLDARAVVRPIVSPEGREFYGHGAFSPDGALLYSTETITDDDYRGVIVVRDGRTLEELGEFPTFGASPHDCRLVDGGRTLVVTNGGSRKPGGEPGSVTYVDVPGEKLLERVEMLDPGLSGGHLDLSKAGDLAVVCSMREWMPREALGAASFRSRGGELRQMTRPAEVAERMRGESLSVSIHEATGIVGVTNPLGNLVTFWDLAAGELRGRLDLAFPRGIATTLDGDLFVVSYGRSPSLLLVEPASLEPVPGSRIAHTQTGGSHVLAHDLG